MVYKKEFEKHAYGQYVVDPNRDNDCINQKISLWPTIWNGVIQIILVHGSVAAYLHYIIVYLKKKENCSVVCVLIMSRVSVLFV